jgi:hypothetical protein
MFVLTVYSLFLSVKTIAIYVCQNQIFIFLEMITLLNHSLEYYYEMFDSCSKLERNTQQNDLLLCTQFD